MKEFSVIQELPDRGETAVGPAAAPPISVAEAPPASLDEALSRLDIEVSKRVRAEEALHEIRERFRQLSEHTGKFLWISDPQTDELIYVSPGFDEVWARTREGSYTTPQDWVNSFKRANRVTLPTSANKSEQIYQVASPDGSVRWIRDRMFPLRDASGQVQRVLGIAEDVTDARLLHETATQSAARTKALYTIIPDLVFRIRKDGMILDAHLGTDTPANPEAQLAGKNLKHLLSSQLATQAMQHLGQALKTRQLVTFTCEYLWPEELRDFETRLIACADDEALVLIRDVTEHKRLEREIVEAASREQQRIGQDLHDSLGQHLTAITFLTKVLERKLTAKAADEAQEAAEIGRLVIQALAQTRNLARGLFPAELEQGGLVAALQELISSIQKTCDIRCELEIEESAFVQDHVLATHVFRIAQEAMNNSAKHGKAKHILVTLKSNGDRIELSVSDDGTGFSPESRVDGLGLRIMNYRARRIGGNLEVTASPQGGTRVTCLFHNKYESN